MSIRSLISALATGMLVVVATPAEAASWPPLDLTNFTSACQTHTGLKAMATDLPAGDIAPIDRLCTCFAGQLTNVSQSDADLLTKDLLGTSTDEERTAHETYEDLASFASSALESCLASGGTLAAAPIVEPDSAPTPETVADIAGFAASCAALPDLEPLNTASGQPPGAARFCGCLAGELERMDPADANILIRNGLNTANAEERAAYENDLDLMNTGTGAFFGCLRSEGLEDIAVAAGIMDPPPAVEPPPLEPAEVGAIPEPPADVAAAPAVAPVPMMRPAIVPQPAAESGRLSTEAVDFLNACAGSAPFRSYLGTLDPGNQTVQGTVCACMTGELVERVSAADFSVLALDFGDPVVKDDAALPDNAAEIAEVGRTSMRSCLSQSGLRVDF